MPAQTILPAFAFTPTFVWSLIASLFILFIPIMIIVALTSGVTFPFMKARLLKRHIIALVKKNGELDFVAADYKSGSSTAETDEYGDFYLVSDGIYRAAGATLSISFESYGVNLTGDLIVSSNKLKSEGFDSYGEIEREFKNLKGELKDEKLKPKGVADGS